MNMAEFDAEITRRERAAATDRMQAGRAARREAADAELRALGDALEAEVRGRVMVRLLRAGELVYNERSDQFLWTQLGQARHYRFKYTTPIAWAMAIASGLEWAYCVGCLRDMRRQRNGSTWGRYRLCLDCHAAGRGVGIVHSIREFLGPGAS